MAEYNLEQQKEDYEFKVLNPEAAKLSFIEQHEFVEIMFPEDGNERRDITHKFFEN